MTSKERVLAAIKRKPVDYIPCLVLCGPSEAEMAEHNLAAIGLDPVMSIDVAGSNAEPIAAARVNHSLATVCSMGTGTTEAGPLFGVGGWRGAAEANPGHVEKYLEREHRDCLAFIEKAALRGVDVILRNSFCNSCDSPNTESLARILRSHLKEEIELAHRTGRVIGLVLDAASMSMLERLSELEFDCVAGIDITATGLELKEVRRILGDRKSFWIGPLSADVKKAVAKVIDVFGKRGLLITASPATRATMRAEDTLAMVEEWRRLRIFP